MITFFRKNIGFNISNKIQQKRLETPSQTQMFVVFFDRNGVEKVCPYNEKIITNPSHETEKKANVQIVAIEKS